MKFEGEHLLPGQVGHFFVLLAFVASILSTVAYFKASRISDLVEKKSWLKYARICFSIQAISIAAIFFTIFYICSNHYFEYLFAYKHASRELEPKYLLACIWEGQEGSFLLWSIWHCVLGSILIFKSKNWEAPVLTVISLAQCFLMLMLLGIYFFDVRIGSSAFVLTRNEINGPIFSQPDYLSFIKDGVGLNVLLRNYWMVIHPPVLFLGFASTIVPFSFAYAGLSTKKYGEWIKPAIPWTLFNCCVLGVGIMMGGKWAYESLSFGGYWAWDPVENAALVPWMVMIAGLHCMVIYNATSNSLRAAFFFIIAGFAFILYSTFLTRTGILGDTSVHSFTETGLAMNLLIGLFAIAFPLPMFIIYIKNYSKIPAIQKEESISSREFWMFIGSLIFFLSALFIIALTSVPVYNKIFNSNIADPQDREFAYNKVMVMVAFIIGTLTAIGQYFKYKQTEKNYFVKKITIPALAALIIILCILFLNPITYRKQGAGFLTAIYLGIFACIFSAIANASYLWVTLKGNLKAAGGAVSHVGFTLMVTGMLITSGNRQVISDNRMTGINIPFDKDPTGRQPEDPLENLTLLKNVPTEMAGYNLTYLSDSGAQEKDRVFYKVSFERKNSGSSFEDFTLTPDVYKMKDNNISSNPDIKHYLFHDLFTNISSITERTNADDTAQYNIHEIKMKDTIFYSKGFLILNNILKNLNNQRFHFNDQDTALVADITVYSRDSTSYKAYPGLEIHNFEAQFNDDTVFSQNLFMRFAGIADKAKFKIAIKESDIPQEYITLKAYIFPYINLVWAGLIIMAGGFILSIARRLKVKSYVTAFSLILIISALFYMFFLAN